MTVDVRCLVEVARNGDSEAWEALDRYADPRLLAYATRRLDVARAREAVAETMARAVAGIERFEWKGSGFDGWLFGILHHVVADAHRARARQGHDPPTETATLEPGPLEWILADEETTALCAAFARLDSAAREPLELRVVAGLSSEEVAVIVGSLPWRVREQTLRHEADAHDHSTDGPSLKGSRWRSGSRHLAELHQNRPLSLRTVPRTS